MDDTMRAGDVCGPDGCDVDAAAPVSFRTTPAVGTRIDIVSVYLLGDQIECELVRDAFPRNSQ